MAESRLKNMIYNGMRRAFSLFLPLLAFVYLVRMLDVDGFGIINYSKSIIEMLTIIAALGIRAYGIRELAVVKDSEKRHAIVSDIFLTNIISSIISIIILVICICWFPQLRLYRVALIIQMPILIMGQIGCEWVYEAYENYKYISVRNIVVQFVALIFTIIFVKKSGDYHLYLMIWSIGECVNGLLNFIFLRKYVHLGLGKISGIKIHICGIIKLFGVALTNNLYSNIDILMIGVFLTAQDIGIYSAGIRIVKLSTLIITSLGSVFLAKFTQYTKAEQEQVVDNAIAVLLVLLYISLPAMCGLFVLKDEIIYIICGSKYSGASEVLLITLPIFIITPIFTFINSNFFVAYGKEEFMYISVGIALAINFVLNLIYIPRYGIVGASIGTVIAEAIGGMVAIGFSNYMVSYFSTAKKYIPEILKSMLASIAMSLVIIGIKKSIEALVLQISVSICLGIIIYVAIMYSLSKEHILLLIKQIESD